MNFPLWVLFLFGNSLFKKGFHKLVPSSLSAELVFLDGFFIIQGLKSALNQMPVMLLNAVERRQRGTCLSWTDYFIQATKVS